MKFFPFLQAYLFAIGNPPHDVALRRFYVDGNNLMGHKGTPVFPEAVAQKLMTVQGADIVLVFDGKKNGDKDSKISTFEGTTFTQVLLGEGISADDFIQQELKDLKQSVPKARVEVVTADRALRRECLHMKPVVKGVINPVVFWRRYRPRLTGLKKPKEMAGAEF